MRTHELKTDSLVFQAVVEGLKTFEIRKDDRDFAVGDHLLLGETEHTGEEMANGSPLLYTGYWKEVVITYILRGPIYGLSDGWVIMGIKEC